MTNMFDTVSSFYEAFPPEEAFRLVQRLEIHHTSKHGSWLNIAEIELSVLKRLYLPERIANIEETRRLVRVWNTERNTKQIPVDWQFKTADARVKLKRLYPKLQALQSTRFSRQKAKVKCGDFSLLSNRA